MERENKLLKAYYDFFDAKLTDSSLVVWIIWALIMLVWYVWAENPYQYTKSSVLDSNKIYISSESNIVDIWGKKYRVIFEEIKD
jgi:hypothetical protein